LGIVESDWRRGIHIMWQLCVKIWSQEEWPSDWCRAVFIPLPKKGNLKECSNHRTISLINHASKILLKIINNRIEEKMEHEIAAEQAGFRAGRGHQRPDSEHLEYQ
jgi:hypothetical protein